MSYKMKDKKELYYKEFFRLWNDGPYQDDDTEKACEVWDIAVENVENELADLAERRREEEKHGDS